MILLGATAALAAPTLFHSAGDDGIPSATPLVIGEEGWGELHLYVRSEEPASSDAALVCLAGDGGEVCGLDLLLQAYGDVYFMSFTPDVGADAIFFVDLQVFRINVLDAVAPTVGTHRLGTLDVVAFPSACDPGVCYVGVESASAVEADLAVVRPGRATLSPLILYAPEPSIAAGLVAGLVLLFVLARRPRRRRRPIALLASITASTMALAALAAPVAHAALGPCGDVDVDGLLTSGDLFLQRLHMADPTGYPLGAAGDARCGVHEASAGCDILSAVVLARRLQAPLRGPVIAPACAAAVPLAVTPTHGAATTARVVTAYEEVIELVATDGTIFRLHIPANAVVTPGGETIRLQEVVGATGFGGSGGVVTGVSITPRNLVLLHPATLEIDLTTVMDGAGLAILAATAEGNEAGFVPSPLDTTAPVDSLTIPFVTLGDYLLTNVSADEVASTPSANAAEDALRELAALTQTAVEEGVVGDAFLSDPETSNLVDEAMREWLDEMRAGIAGQYTGCDDIAALAQGQITWAVQDQLFATDIWSSEDPDDQTRWNAFGDALTTTSALVAARLQQAVDTCNALQDGEDPCAEYTARHETYECMRWADYLLTTFGRGPLSPGLTELLQVCTEAPDHMAFRYLGGETSDGFDVCPGDPDFAIEVEVQDQFDTPVAVAGGFAWSTGDPSIATPTPLYDEATIVLTGNVGIAPIEAEWNDCPDFPATTNVYVGIAPLLVGWWNAAGTVSQDSCQDPGENFPPTYAEVPGEIEVQLTLPDGSVEFNVFGYDWEGTAIVECGGEGAEFAGVDDYTFEGGWGRTTYSGALDTVVGAPGHWAAIVLSVSWVSQDMAGDTCHSPGTAVITRVIP